MKFTSITVSMMLLATYALAASDKDISLRGSAMQIDDDNNNDEPGRDLQASTDWCSDVADWKDRYNDDCSWYDNGGSCIRRRNGENDFALTAKQACCKCGGGWRYDELVEITASNGWQFFTHRSWIWDIDFIKMYSSSDCDEGTYIDPEQHGAVYMDSGNAGGDTYAPENAFREDKIWGGRCEGKYGSLYVGVIFEDDVDVRCVKMKSRQDGPIMIRRLYGDYWTNVHYERNLVAGSDGWATMVIDTPIHVDM